MAGRFPVQQASAGPCASGWVGWRRSFLEFSDIGPRFRLPDLAKVRSVDGGGWGINSLKNFQECRSVFFTLAVDFDAGNLPQLNCTTRYFRIDGWRTSLSETKYKCLHISNAFPLLFALKRFNGFPQCNDPGTCAIPFVGYFECGRHCLQVESKYFGKFCS